MSGGSTPPLGHQTQDDNMMVDKRKHNMYNRMFKDTGGEDLLEDLEFGKESIFEVEIDGRWGAVMEARVIEIGGVTRTVMKIKWKRGRWVDVYENKRLQCLESGFYYADEFGRAVRVSELEVVKFSR